MIPRLLCEDNMVNSDMKWSNDEIDDFAHYLLVLNVAMTY